MTGCETSVTILFADISHSTGLYERLGDTEAQRLITHTLAVMGREAMALGGTVVKNIGDEIMCAFPDPCDAARAAQNMHEQVFRDSLLHDQAVSIRIGIHCGEAILKDDDYFGDAVNVASRATDMAKADQIVVTMDMADALSQDLTASLRNIGRMRVEGKTVDLDFFELHWRADDDTLTIMAGHQDFRSPAPKSRLRLRSPNVTRELSPTDPPLQLGRDERNDLILTTRYTSRRHASIRFANGRYLLKDFSINGTYLYPEGGEPIFLLREEAPLTAQGVISFGQDLDEEGAEPFEYLVSQT